MPVRPFDQIGDEILFMQDEPAGVEGVGRFLIGEVGQLSRVRGEEIKKGGFTAHFSDIHEPGIGDEGGPGDDLFDGGDHLFEQHHIRLKIVESEGIEGTARKVCRQMPVQILAALAAADVTHQVAVGRRSFQQFQSRYRRRDHRRGAPVYRDPVLSDY